eukprot:Opistho-1_new@17992
MKNKSVQFIIIFVAILGVNLLASRLFFRLDLTQEKRYTISEASKNLLQNLDDEIYVKVYLTGKGIPAGFKRLENAVKETLDEFQIYGGTNIKYIFIDLNAEYKDAKTRNEKIAKIAQKGITPTNVYNNEDGKKTQSLILPGAIIT